MRRAILLILVIVALVIAVALLRPSVIAPGTGATTKPATPAVVERDPEPPSVTSDVLENAAPTPPATAPAKPAPPTTISPRGFQPPQKCRVTVVDPDSKPVAAAVILVVKIPSSGNPKVEDRRTEEDGTLEVILEASSATHFYSYKVGVGAGAAGPVFYEPEVKVRFEACHSLKIRCVSTNDVPLYEAGVVLTTELFYAERRDRYGNPAPMSVSLPPRKLMTNAEGVCTFSGVFAAGPAKDPRKQIPAIRHTIAADWHTLKALETIEKNVDEFSIFLQ